MAQAAATYLLQPIGSICLRVLWRCVHTALRVEFTGNSCSTAVVPGIAVMLRPDAQYLEIHEALHQGFVVKCIRMVKVEVCKQHMHCKVVCRSVMQG